MNKQKVISELQAKYPGKAIFAIPDDNPSEILCEIDPTSLHKDYSVAIAVIDKSAPHVHKSTTEEYEVISGNLTLYKDDKRHELHPGDVIVIHPNEVHYAVGAETYVRATSHPGWTPTDHVLIEGSIN